VTIWAVLCLSMASPASAISPDEWEQQRALKEWNDMSRKAARPLLIERNQETPNKTARKTFFVFG